jgi:hypothetical protein
VPPCLNELQNYVGCAVSHLQLCLRLPLEDGACTDAKLGNVAEACAGAPPAGCQVLAGVAQTAGIFCCP